MSDIIDFISDDEYELNIALLNSYLQDKHTNTLSSDTTEYEDIINLDREPVSENDRLFQEVYVKLNMFQKEILKECVYKKSGGMSLPLGSGKTLLALTISLYLTRETQMPILVVAAKSLIASWAFEIQKFFGDNLKFEIIHQSIQKKNLKVWKIKPDTQLILTTADVLSKFYKENNINKDFIVRKYLKRTGVYEIYYNEPQKPFLTHVLGGGLFHSLKWGCLIIDEAQMYTNISTLRCQALGSICSENRWLLSGTLFDEPKVERILGYHILLNASGKPRNLPDTKKMVFGNIQHGKFKGLNEYLVSRKSNKAFIPPKVHEEIITHSLLPEEEKIYTMMRAILIEVQKKAKHAKLVENVHELRKFTSYKMVMIMYLRQAVICPLIPIASIAIDASDMAKRSQLSKVIMEEVGKLGIDDYLNDVNSVKSTRVCATIKCLKKHIDEKVIVFSCFKSYLDIMQHFMINSDRPILRMHSSMSLQKRGQLVQEFKNTENGVLMMTYELGATGLNLQFATTVLLVDFWWNAARTQQAIGRIFRFGQIAEQINIYFFSANTGIEKIIYEKQNAKLQILEELKIGNQKSKIPRIKMDDVIKMIDIADNKKLLNKIEFY